MRGCAAMWRRRSSRDRTRSAVGSMAMQLAERILPSNSDISPKASPGRRIESVTSRPFSPKMTTFTRPLMITNMVSPGSSCETTVPCAATRRTLMRWVRSSIATGGSAANSGARARAARIRAGSSSGAAVRDEGAMLRVMRHFSSGERGPRGRGEANMVPTGAQITGVDKSSGYAPHESGNCD